MGVHCEPIYESESLGIVGKVDALGCSFEVVKDRGGLRKVGLKNAEKFINRLAKNIFLVSENHAISRIVLRNWVRPLVLRYWQIKPAWLSNVFTHSALA